MQKERKKREVYKFKKLIKDTGPGRAITAYLIFAPSTEGNKRVATIHMQRTEGGKVIRVDIYHDLGGGVTSWTATPDPFPHGDIFDGKIIAGVRLFKKNMPIFKHAGEFPPINGQEKGFYFEGLHRLQQAGFKVEKAI